VSEFISCSLFFVLTVGLCFAGQVLTTKLKVILSEHNNGSAKISPNNRHHNKHSHKAVLHSNHNGSRESYFKQSVLLRQLLYPKDVKPTVSSDPHVAPQSVSALIQFIDRVQLEDAELEWYSSTDRLLMHARLCFEDEFVQVLAPSREQVTFTVLALKVRLDLLRRKSNMALICLFFTVSSQYSTPSVGLQTQCQESFQPQ
jgi:hypothetical protein